ncbi:MAG: hypothetical protein VX468_08020, partial [Pseudomonadota bacterium]|nr:hypothetical protein [Pseudomonadota bacterium]
MKLTTLKFVENKIISGKADKYINVHVDAAAVIKSWKSSVFSFEWLTPNGTVKPLEALNDGERAKREAVEQDIDQGKNLETPILGIGLMENVEIGAGRALFLTLFDKGEKTIPVHIPKSNEKDFAKFIKAKS